MTITLRALNDDDLDVLFRWESDPTAARMAAFTRPDPMDRAAFDAHYQRVLSDPENWTRAIAEDGVLIGMIASFTREGDRELTYWVDPSRWGPASHLKLCDCSSRTSLVGRSTRELRSTTLAHVGCLSGTDS